MRRFNICKIFLAAAFGLTNCLTPFAQNPEPNVAPQVGSVKFTAQVQIDGKTEKLDRKRFYLIRGSRGQHADLLRRIAETPIVSRDCYYANLRRDNRKISDSLFCWLKEHDCETPYCREVKTKEEALAIPEFAAAYNQGLREYKRPVPALKWITTNLPDDIRIGFYRRQKSVINQLIDFAKTDAQAATQAKKGAARPGEGFQSIMTDRLGNAYFLDVDIAPPEKMKTETYLITNLTPIIYGDTGYVWTCDVEFDPSKPLNKIILKNYIGSKKCDVVMKKLTEACDAPTCAKPG